MQNRPPRDRYGRPLPPGSRDEPGREEPAGPAREACRRGIELFDARRFFEAHEFFEYVWKSGEVEERYRGLWKGVTQVAVGCCHLQRGNARGAVAVLERAVGYLKGYRGVYWGVDVQGLLGLARKVAGQVRRRGTSHGLNFPPLPRGGRKKA